MDTGQFTDLYNLVFLIGCLVTFALGFLSGSHR